METTGDLFVNGRFLTQPVTGVQRFAEQVTAALIASGVNAVVLVPPGPRREDSPVPAERIRQVGRRTGQLWEQVDLARHVRKHRGAVLLNLANTAPVVVRDKVTAVHDITFVRHPETFSRAFRTWYRVLIPLVLRSSRAVLTVSEFSREEICSTYGIDPSRVHVVGNAVDDRFRPAAAPHEPDPSGYFLTVSSPSPHKNVDRLLRAYADLAADHHARLLVVGSVARTLRSGDLTWPDGAEALGRVDDDRLIALYQGALAFVFPSLYEGFGIPPLEAQKCGCPVIASRIPPLTEVLADSADYVDPTSTASITEAMTRVLSDPQHRADLVRRGLANAARFSWEASAARVRQVVEDVRRAR